MHPEPYLLVVLWWTIVHNRNHHQFDIYNGCHAILAITTKIFMAVFLWNTVNHQLEGFDMLAEGSKVWSKVTAWKKSRTEMELVLFISVSIHILQQISLQVNMYQYWWIFWIVVYYFIADRYRCVHVPEFIYLTRSLLIDIQIVFRFFPVTNNAAVCMFILWYIKFCQISFQ